MANKLDLHMHSSVSNDGDFEPAELMRLCREQLLETVALTDHNSVRGTLAAKQAAKEQGLAFISGIELDCQFEDVNLHVLGYGINPAMSAFAAIEKDILKQEQDASFLLMQKILDLGIYFDREKVFELSIEDVVTGEMIAEAALSDMRNENNPLLENFRKGGTRSDNPYVNFYWDFCSQGKPACIPMHYIDLCECVHLIKEAGGMAVLAHPGINIGQNQQRLQGIIACGIDGIEVFSSYHDDCRTAFFSEQAEKYQLLKTIGSDFHGKIKPSIKLGAINCPEEADIYQRLMRSTSFCAQYR